MLYVILDWILNQNKRELGRTFWGQLGESDIRLSPRCDGGSCLDKRLSLSLHSEVFMGKMSRCLYLLKMLLQSNTEGDRRQTISDKIKKEKANVRESNSESRRRVSACLSDPSSTVCLNIFKTKHKEKKQKKETMKFSSSLEINSNY